MGLLHFIEHFGLLVNKIFPFYFALKSVFAIWLFLPKTMVFLNNKGALFVYNTILKLWIPKLDKIAQFVKKKEEKKEALVQKEDIKKGLFQTKIVYGK